MIELLFCVKLIRYKTSTCIFFEQSAQSTEVNNKYVLAICSKDQDQGRLVHNVYAQNNQHKKWCEVPSVMDI